MRDSFVFYRSFFESVKELEDKDKVLILRSLIEYALDGKEPDISGLHKAIFTLMRPNIDANTRKWENGKKGSESGNKGGRPKKENPTITPPEPQENPTITPPEPQENPTQTPNVDVDEDENVNVNEEKEKKRSRFSPPSIIEIKNFISEEKYSVNAETFFNFYSSNGWQVGKNKMKDWRAAVRTWNSKEKENKKSTHPAVEDLSGKHYEKW